MSTDTRPAHALDKIQAAVALHALRCDCSDEDGAHTRRILEAALPVPSNPAPVAEALAHRLLEGQKHQGGPVPVDSFEDARLYAEWLLQPQSETCGCRQWIEAKVADLWGETPERHVCPQCEHDYHTGPCEALAALPAQREPATPELDAEGIRLLTEVVKWWNGRSPGFRRRTRYELFAQAEAYLAHRDAAEGEREEQGR